MDYNVIIAIPHYTYRLKFKNVTYVQLKRQVHQFIINNLGLTTDHFKFKVQTKNGHKTGNILVEIATKDLLDFALTAQPDVYSLPALTKAMTESGLTIKEQNKIISHLKGVRNDS